MKVTLDLDKLLNDGDITVQEYQKFKDLAAQSTASLAFNLLIGFGVVAVSLAILALIPTATTSIALGLFVLIAGLLSVRSGHVDWRVLANICILIGALMSGGGIIAEFNGSLGAILSVTLLLAASAIIARSALLSVLATLMLSASIGAKGGYFHASYFLVIQEPTITVIAFTVVAVVLYQLSKQIPQEYEGIALTAARTSIFLINFGFWVGSLWGDDLWSDVFDPSAVPISDNTFALGWAIALLATAVWSWRQNRRWVLNTVATFGGIHFYTQWFEFFGTSPNTLLIAGVLALGFAVSLQRINVRMKRSDVG